MRLWPTLGARSGSRPHTARAGSSLQHIIESRLETPVFFIVTAMMVIRAAQQFSGGALIMSRFLGAVWYPRFEIVTGLGLGLGSEMLMTIAGRTWRSWKREETEIAARSGLSKIQRASYVAQAKANTKYSKRFMYVGMGASLYTGVSFLLTNATANLGAGLADVVTVAIISATVLYLGVFREAHTQDATEGALAHIEEGLNAALDAAIARFRDGTSTDQDHAFIAEHLPAHKQARFRRSVAKHNQGRVWRAAQVREALGIGQDARRIRELNRQINALAKTAENGLDKAEDGRTWLIPHNVVMDVWGEEIMGRRAAARLSGARDTDRTAEGHGPRIISALPSSSPDTYLSTSEGAPATGHHTAGALALSEPFR